MRSLRKRYHNMIQLLQRREASFSMEVTVYWLCGVHHIISDNFRKLPESVYLFQMESIYCSRMLDPEVHLLRVKQRLISFFTWFRMHA